MRILGIDNGLDGGLVLLGDDGRVAERQPMPTLALKAMKRAYDAASIVRLLTAWAPDHAFIETAQAMPPELHGRRQGTASSFSIGFGYGVGCGILAGMRIPFTSVHPRTWMATMLHGTTRDPRNPKGASAFVCGRLWPAVDWRVSDRARIPHSGLCDAALVAEYGRRLLTAGAARDRSVA